MNRIESARLKEIHEVMKRNGVSTYVVLHRDPDDGSFWSAGAGDRTWALGALHRELIKREADDCLPDEPEIP